MVKSEKCRSCFMLFILRFLQAYMDAVVSVSHTLEKLTGLTSDCVCVITNAVTSFFVFHALSPGELDSSSCVTKRIFDSVQSYKVAVFNLDCHLLQYFLSPANF